MDEPTVREQLDMCIVAYKQGEEAYELKSDPESEETWWFSVCINRLAALINDTEYRAPSYAEWVFKDQINDAWADSDNEYDYDLDRAQREQQEEWVAEWEAELMLGV